MSLKGHFPVTEMSRNYHVTGQGLNKGGRIINKCLSETTEIKTLLNP